MTLKKTVDDERFLRIEMDDTYREFLINNRIRVNRYLNIVLWFFVLTGPAIASGIAGGVFKDITYRSCWVITLYVAVMALVHLVLKQKMPDSVFTGLFALTALDLLLVYMTIAHVSIYLTWFLVPVLGLLFIDRLIFFYSVILNYILMAISIGIITPYRMVRMSSYGDALAYYRDVMGGYTIETIILVASAYMVGRLSAQYYHSLFDRDKMILAQQKDAEEKMNTLNSLVEIYDNVNLIDFEEQTEMSLRGGTHEKHEIDFARQNHTKMNRRIKHSVMPDQLEDFLNYTNINTVRARLAHKKIISADFIDVVQGWFRAQYISVDAPPDGIPTKVIYTTRNVDEEKRREEHLVRISLTDEMTRLFNRRCYDEDLRVNGEGNLPEDLVLFSVDVNGLKTVNDTKGHAAGDELIKGAADVLSFSVGKAGKVYRIGGDEFAAIVHTTEPEQLRSTMMENTSQWHGVYCDHMAMSVGYASLHKHPNASMEELEHIADQDMYEEKSRYYRDRGIDRRH